MICLNRPIERVTQNATQPSRKVSVTLFGAARMIEGIEVPKGFAERGSDYLRANGPCDVTVQLPDGARKRLSAKYVSINIESATVVDIHVLPLEKSLPFKEAVAELHRLLSAMEIEADERMKEKIKKEWPDDSPGFDPIKRPGFYPLSYDAGTWLSEDVGLGVRLRPADDGGWFVVLTFAVSAPKRRALWERPETRPPTQPTTSTYPTAEDERVKRFKEWEKTHDRIDVDRLLNDPNYKPKPE